MPVPLSLRLANLRSLSDTGRIVIRPITILVGKNNSGKSSFTRFFPLLKQSVEGNANAPLLWYGPYVDFGSFDETLSTFSSNGTITLEFSLPISPFRTGYSSAYSSPLDGIDAIDYAADLISRGQRTAIRAVRLSIASELIEFTFADEGKLEGVTINGVDHSQFFSPNELIVQNAHLVPVFVLKEPRLQRRSVFFMRTGQGPLTTADPQIFELLKKNLHGNITSATVNRILNSLSYHPTDAFIKALETRQTNSSSWRTYVEHVKAGLYRHDLTRLRYLYLIRNIPFICGVVERSFQGIANGISYVGPARAPTDRYYRMQELAVAQLDPAAANFAMFLNSLRVDQLHDFESWTQQYFGYSILPRRSLGHVSLMLRDENTRSEYNLADMGYGFSQVFPVMAQIWVGLQQSYDIPFRVVAVEQPELHLHPAFQTKIADALVGAINATRTTAHGGDLSIVVETHSEALINRLGELIQEKHIGQEDIGIYLFEKELESDFTTVKAAAFDGEGVLENWPFGFFSGRESLRSY